MIRCNYRKLKNELTSKCWFCQSWTNSILIYPDGSEIWACSFCAGKHGKIKKFKHLVGYNTKITNQTILESNLCVKKAENPILNEILEVEA